MHCRMLAILDDNKISSLEALLAPYEWEEMDNWQIIDDVLDFINLKDESLLVKNNIYSIDSVIIERADVPDITLEKHKIIWEQLKENSPLENGVPELYIGDYPEVLNYSSFEEYIDHQTLKILFNVYGIVSTAVGWKTELRPKEIQEILKENKDKYLVLVECNV